MDTGNYCIRREWAQSRDGTAVPMTLVHPRNIQGPMPTLCVGYGAYGENVDTGAAAVGFRSGALTAHSDAPSGHPAR